jgi:hypothetical protein
VESIAAARVFEGVAADLRSRVKQATEDGIPRTESERFV